MGTVGITLLVIAAVFVVFVLAVIGIYNALIRLRNQVDNAWSQIDVQLKRRHD
ncbi:MAG: LemA family protein, partial [Planctomycetota bacterium]